MFGKIIPSTSLAVEGSSRTLTWVDVIPSTGATVGVVGGGRGVCVGCGVRVGDRVGAGMKAVGDVVTSWLEFVVQLLIIRVMTIMLGEIYLKATI